jgi:hypothetical protein
MAALSVFVFQCADSDLYALTLYRSGDNLPADACAGSWVYRARLLLTKRERVSRRRLLASSSPRSFCCPRVLRQ